MAHRHLESSQDGMSRLLHPAVWPVRLSNSINWPILVENNVLASQYPHCHDHANYKLLNAHYYQTVLNDTNQRDHTLR